MTEVRRLLQIHGQLGGTGPGRRWGSEVLNKSAVVLLVACWEAYLEDLVTHAFDESLNRCDKPRKRGLQAILTGWSWLCSAA
jgi:hypothetical protein